MHVPWQEDLANTRLYELACSKAIRTLIFGTMWRQNARDFATIYKATQLPYVTEVCRLPGFEEMWRISAHIKAGIIPPGGRSPNFNLGLEDIPEEDESARGLNLIDSEDAREEYRESHTLSDSDEMLCDSSPREEIDVMEVDFDVKPSFARDYNIAQPADGSFRLYISVSGPVVHPELGIPSLPVISLTRKRACSVHEEGSLGKKRRRISLTTKINLI